MNLSSILPLAFLAALTASSAGAADLPSAPDNQNPRREIYYDDEPIIWSSPSPTNDAASTWTGYEFSAVYSALRPPSVIEWTDGSFNLRDLDRILRQTIDESRLAGFSSDAGQYLALRAGFDYLNAHQERITASCDCQSLSTLRFRSQMRWLEFRANVAFMAQSWGRHFDPQPLIPYISQPSPKGKP